MPITQRTKGFSECVLTAPNIRFATNAYLPAGGADVYGHHHLLPVGAGRGSLAAILQTDNLSNKYEIDFYFDTNICDIFCKGTDKYIAN
jgi:hypothetical protein